MRIFTKNSFKKLWSTAFVLLSGAYAAQAQLPVCSGTTGGLTYLHVGSSIYNFDPTQPIVPGVNPILNTIGMPSGANGLAVSPNLNATTPATTFYTCVNNLYYYYNGATWTNTGHSVGNAAAVNPGAGGGYIYNLVGATGQVYTYNGTGNGTLLTTVTGYNGGGPYDLVADCGGNWYILSTSTSTGQYLRKYDATGVLLQSWTLTGAPNTSAGGGLAIIGNTLYYHNNTPNWITGTIGATTVTITSIAPGLGTYSPSDNASCPIGGIASVQASIDTGYYCGTGPGVPVSALGTGPFTWTVISGPAVIAGSGTNITVTSTPGISKIVLSSSATSLCSANGTDTVTIVVPTANLAVPATDTVDGCGIYQDTLHASLFNTIPWITYNVAWTPTNVISSGANTLNPVVNPTANTTYYVTVSTPANRGGCTWKDSIKSVIRNQSVTANFNFSIKYGCSQDTIVLQNLSSANIRSQFWDFFDNTGDTAKNPIHIYTTQANHQIKLLVANNMCKDSLTKPVNTLHPLQAAFTLDDDSVCQGQLINFTNTSVTTVINNINPTFWWDFGDGANSILQDPVHTYLKTGVYTVKMVVTDFVPCSDTAYHIVVVDSLPHAYITLTDSIICEGAGVTFTADYLKLGNTKYTWDFGDGTHIDNVNPILHAFDSAGTYTIRFNAEYRICRDTFDTKQVQVKPYPQIDLGPDTTICPNAGFVRLADRASLFNPAVTYLWNTGATVFSILADSPGIYYATATMDGCSTTDSVQVFQDCYLNVPNSFTPNGDGTNDYFLPRQLLSRGVTRFVMKIYNRWGQSIFETSSIDGRGWDGKFNDVAQPTGVYIYMIDVTFTNGRSEKYQGNVTLLR